MLEALDQALSDLEQLDADALSADELNELIGRFQRARSRFDSAEASLLAAWDARRCWQLDNAKTGAAWLAWRGRLPIEDCRRRLRHARALRQLPAVHEAWAAGEIGRAHIASMLGALTPRTADAFAADHEMLLDAAKRFGFKDFLRVRDHWVAHVDLDGAEQAAAAEEAAREVHLAESFDGMWFGKMTFDRVRGTIVSDCITRLERELFEADWKEAAARVGRDPNVDDLARTSAQRRADAMVEMARRAQAVPPGARLPVPLFTVVVGYETFAGPVCELWNRTTVTPGTVARWMSDADIERVVFDGPSRVVDVGAKRRFFRGATRRAIEVRDRTCFDRTCDDPPERPEIDHRQPYAKGGDTTQANGRLGCGFHNRHRDHDRWAEEPSPQWVDGIDADASEGVDPDPPDDPDPPVAA